MKIAFVIPSLANTGPIIMVRDLARYLTDQGHHCDVFYFDDIRELHFPCKVQQIKFRKAIDFGAYQIVHSHLFRPDLYCAFHRKKIRKARAKSITTIHTAIYHDLEFTYGRMVSRLLIPIWEWAWKRIRNLVVLTTAAKKYYIHIPAQIEVVNNGRILPEIVPEIDEIDRAAFQALKAQYQLLGTVCGLDSRKGIEQIVSLLKIKQKYAFVVVGDGSQRKNLESLAKAAGVSDRLKIIGFRKEGYRYLPMFDIFVLPSRSEGMPLAFLEAMALNVPIVCSNIPAFQDFQGDICSFFELDDIISLEKACQNALDFGDQLANNAYKKYLNNYTVSKMAKKYLYIYTTIK